MSSLHVPQTLEQNQAYTDEEMREFEEHLAQQEQDLSLKADDIQKQRDELERQQEQLNAQKMELQQVKSGIPLLYFQTRFPTVVLLTMNVANCQHPDTKDLLENS